MNRIPIDFLTYTPHTPLVKLLGRHCDFNSPLKRETILYHQSFQLQAINCNSMYQSNLSRPTNPIQSNTILPTQQSNKQAIQRLFFNYVCEIINILIMISNNQASGFRNNSNWPKYSHNSQIISYNSCILF
jgi:hypothetical protein